MTKVINDFINNRLSVFIYNKNIKVLNGDSERRVEADDLPQKHRRRAATARDGICYKTALSLMKKGTFSRAAALEIGQWREG